MKYPSSWFSKWLLVRLPAGVSTDGERFEALRHAVCDAVATLSPPSRSSSTVQVLTGVLDSDPSSPRLVREAHIALERMFGMESFGELHRRLGIEETEH